MRLDKVGSISEALNMLGVEIESIQVYPGSVRQYYIIRCSSVHEDEEDIKIGGTC